MHNSSWHITVNISTPSETEKAKDQWIRYRLMTTDNEKYVKRGQALIIRDDPQRREEAMAANRNKVGAPFQYAESLFTALAAVKSMTGLPYRHLQGMLVETLGDWDTPCYTTIYRRFQALEVKRSGSVFTVTGGGTVPVRLAVDSTGLKQHNRGEWIRHKWKVRRGFVKLHVTVDMDTKKILAVQVTDDRTGDSPMLIPLLDEALEAATRTGQAQDSAAGPADAGCRLHGDAAYASRSDVAACGDRGVDSRIRPKVNSTARGKGTGDAWGIAVRKQLGGSARSSLRRGGGRTRSRLLRRGFYATPMQASYGPKTMPSTIPRCFLGASAPCQDLLAGRRYSNAFRQHSAILAPGQALLGAQRAESPGWIPPVSGSRTLR